MVEYLRNHFTNVRRHKVSTGPHCVRFTGVFSECHNNDEERARKLLVQVSPSWGRTTCLRLALEADDKSFVAQSGVQVGKTSLL